MQWAVPVYDQETNQIIFVGWNESSDKPCDVTVITNNSKVFNFPNLKKLHWFLEPLGSPEEISYITILINNKLKRHIHLNKDNIEEFKLYNFIKDD